LSVFEYTVNCLDDICSITALCIDKIAYLEALSKLENICLMLMCKHHLVMSLIFVARMLDSPENDRFGRGKRDTGA